MAGLCKTKYKDGKHRAWYMDWQGKQIFFRGTTDPKESLRIAKSKEDFQQRIKLGDIEPPKASDAPRVFGRKAADTLTRILSKAWLGSTRHQRTGAVRSGRTKSADF